MMRGEKGDDHDNFLSAEEEEETFSSFARFWNAKCDVHNQFRWLRNIWLGRKKG